MSIELLQRFENSVVNHATLTSILSHYRAPNAKIHRMVQEGTLIPLKKGLYAVLWMVKVYWTAFRHTLRPLTLNRPNMMLRASSVTQAPLRFGLGHIFNNSASGCSSTNLTGLQPKATMCSFIAARIDRSQQIRLVTNSLVRHVL